MQKIKQSCHPDGWPAGRPMKTILNKLFEKELKKILPEKRSLFLKELNKEINKHKKRVKNENRRSS